MRMKSCRSSLRKQMQLQTWMTRPTAKNSKNGGRSSATMFNFARISIEIGGESQSQSYMWHECGRNRFVQQSSGRGLQQRIRMIALATEFVSKEYQKNLQAQKQGQVPC